MRTKKAASQLQKILSLPALVLQRIQTVPVKNVMNKSPVAGIAE